MFLHTWRHQGPHKPSSCATFMLNSHWDRAAIGKKKVLCLCVWGHFHRVQLFVTLQTVACQASLSGRGVLQGRILEGIGQYWVPYPSRALYFLLPQPPTPLRTWCCQNPCDLSSCPPPHLALTGANPSPPGQSQEQTPVDDPHAEVEIKITIETQGQCG